MFRRAASQAFETSVSHLWNADTGDIVNIVEHPEIPPPGMGDISFPCFTISKKLRRNPSELALSVARHITGSILRDEKTDRRLLKSAEGIGGYVNISFSGSELAYVTVDTVLRMGSSYGKPQWETERREKVIVEHTSANPTGPLHVGRARNPIIGDTLVRVLRRAGYSVKSEYYINDMGKQAAMLIWGAINIKDAGTSERDRPDYRLVNLYQAANREIEKSDGCVEKDLEGLILQMEKGDETVLRQAEHWTKQVMDGINESLTRLNVHIDAFTRESVFVRNRSVEKVIEKVKTLPNSGNEDGALYITTKELECSPHSQPDVVNRKSASNKPVSKDKETVTGGSELYYLTRKDGSTLYTTRDIAYHLDKLSRCDIAINVLGEDQKRAMEQLKYVLKQIDDSLDTNRLKIVYYSFVSLPEGRMSTRSGKVVYIDDLMDEAVERAYREVKNRRAGELDDEQMRDIAVHVGIGAIRYNIARIQPEKQMVFRWEEALNFEGNSAPFIQYAHARACSILRKASEIGIKTDYERHSHPLFRHLTPAPAELALIRKIAALPGKVAECCLSLKTHTIASYAHELASEFNQFYRDCPVLTVDENLRNARLSLVLAAKITMANTMDALGIKAPEEM